MSFEVVNSSIFSTIQDKGRFSYTSIGVTNSGVMDEYAYLMANKMLENNLDTNIIEISFSNLILKSNINTTIVITGAVCEFFINNIAACIWETHRINVGDIIKVGKLIKGSRVYLGVKNGFDIKKEFGSNATTIKEKLGGISGEKLKNGDILPCKNSNYKYKIRLKDKYVPLYTNELELRVILAYQDNNFQKEQIKKFFSSTYTVTNEFNRMGCKLSGEPIYCDINGIISEGISFGAIQIPSDGQPIILLKDRQTIGGYPKIGSVLSIDCFKLAQVKPDCKITFKPISIDEAQNKV